MKEKLKIIQNNLIGILLFCIILIGFILRIININQPTGLWLDELFSLYEAQKSFPFEIVKTLSLFDIHVPFYYFILHFWIKLFGNHDIALRLFSVFLGVLNIPVIYLAGKDLDSKKTGLIAALFIAINSFLIYYSQEVRFYALATLFSSLSILFVIKITKFPQNKFLYGLMITNIMLTFTFTIGIIFVLLEIFFLAIFIHNEKKTFLKKFLLIEIIPFLLFLLYFPVLKAQMSICNDIFFDRVLNWHTLILYMQNWFSPYILGLYSNFSDYFTILKHSEPKFYLYIFAPILIMLTGITISILKNHICRIIFLAAASFLIFEFIATSLGYFRIICRYTIIIIPLLLLIGAYGLTSIKKRFLSNGLISIFVFINIFYIFLNKNSILKQYRELGFNIPVIELKQNFKLNENDIVIMSENGELFKHYYKSQYGKVLDFSTNNMLTSEDFLSNNLLQEIFANNYNFLKPYFIKNKPFYSLKIYMKNNVINHLEKDRYFIIIRNKTVVNKTNEDLSKIFKDKELYEKEHLIKLVENKILNDIEKTALENYSLISTIYKGSWVIKVYQNL